MTRVQGKKKVDKKTEGEKVEVGQKAGEKRAIITQPAYRREPRIANPEAPQHILQCILEVEVPNLKVCDLLALSGDLHKEIVEQTHTQNKSSTINVALVLVPEVPLEFAMPLREVEVVVMRRRRELELLDEGLEIVIVQEDLCEELGLEINQGQKMTMQTANGGKEEMQGCVEFLELEVGGVKTYTHMFVV
ncbi:hypothetical protein AN958_02763 [Leucoagaricus sp. SymC.cos]|nr:hypothetical protein AN958_02763 [Leucoagaricus sp. SymC.cos]